MIIGQIAKRPSIYHPLKGDTNDYSTNAYSLTTNNGVTTTTGIFGESNGAYEWNADTDYLEINSSAKTHLEGSSLENITMLLNVSVTDNTALNTFGYAIYGTNTSDRIISNAYRGNDATDVLRGFIYPTTGFVIYDYNYTPNNNQWYQWVVTAKSGENYIYVDGIKVTTNTTTFSNSKTSTQPLRIGAQQNIIGGRLKMCNLRLYNTQLTDAQIKILNNEKGRIRA